MSQQDVEIVRQAMQAFLENDFETWFDLTDPACRLYPRPEEPGVKECYEGWDEMLTYLANWFSGWKEYTGEPVRFMDAGDWVVVEIEEVGVAENGMRIQQRFAHAFRLENGKGVEWRMFGPVEEAFEALRLTAQASAEPTVAAADVDLAEVDLMDPKWFADGPPHELFARMRREAPVRWNALPDGSGFWSLTRHADIAAVSRDYDTWSSWRAGIFLNPDQVVPLDLTRNLLLYKDPPEHTKYRAILQKAFTPHTVAKLEDEARAIVTRTLDDVVAKGSCDFARDIAVPVPLTVLAALMGLPTEDIPKLYEWTEQIEAAQRAPEPAAAADVFVEMAGYLHEQIRRQAEQGSRDSLVMQLRGAEVDGERLDDSEILVFFGLLVFAGNDTTRNTAAAGMRALLEHPDQLRSLVEDPAGIPAAVEEILRWTSVVNWFARTAKVDTEIAGRPIAEGDKVVMWYPSGSRDEAVFDDPQRFDVTRPKPDHQAFGGGGRHFCLGAGLARLELRVLFEEVLRRMPDIALAGAPHVLASNWAHMVDGLPVRFSAA